MSDMRIAELNSGEQIKNCGAAAAMSYGKDLSAMSDDEVSAYVQRIWDKHTNVSEHFVKTIYFAGVPRLLTLLMAFQRHGFTMTEMSQRRRKVSSSNVVYHDLLQAGAKHEDARKVLSVLEPSECIVTMNREAAKGICGILKKQSRILTHHELSLLRNFPNTLGVLFGFDPNEVAESGPDFQETTFTPDEAETLEEGGFICDLVANRGELYIWGVLPVYSFHQFVRHRTLELGMWCFDGDVLSLNNSDAIRFVSHCTLTALESFVKTRSGAATQEPLRSFAKKLGEQANFL